MRYLRRFDSLPDHTDKIFVVDENDVLQGVLPIRKLLVADPEDMVADVMATEVVRFRPEDDVEEAAQAFERYDLVTAPVVDENKKLIGRITIDEMVDVIREESEADMLNMAGLQEEEDLFAPVWDSVKNRWMWLAINLCTAFIASRVIGAFEGSIEKNRRTGRADAHRRRYRRQLRQPNHHHDRPRHGDGANDQHTGRPPVEKKKSASPSSTALFGVR